MPGEEPGQALLASDNPALHLLGGDLLTLPDLPKNLEVVFHLAGLTKAANRSDYYTVNQQGTARLVDHLLQHGLRPKFIYLSSLAAGRPATDNQPVKEGMNHLNLLLLTERVNFWLSRKF